MSEDHHSTWCAEIDGSHCAAIASLLERVSALEDQSANPPIVRESDAAYASAQWQAVTDSAVARPNDRRHTEGDAHRPDRGTTGRH